MSQLALALPRPRYWEDFELLTLQVFRREWDDDDAQMHGRRGQEQAGVDVYGHDTRGRAIGVQCKRRSLLKADGTEYREGKLSRATILGDVEKAEKFRPELNAFVVATTLSRDTKLQAIARQLTAERKKSGQFGVKIWFWEDTEDVLNRHGELLSWYFEHVVGRDATRTHPDQLILGVLQTAFSRPAFTTEMHVENGGADFIQAIIDTQQAINTGLLVTRDGDVVERAPGIKRLSNAQWRQALRRISRFLQEARDVYTRALQAGHIRDEGILIVDYEVADRINVLRAEALRALNNVLAEASLEPVDSPLLEL